eukprot:TRINITY_DN63169_c0_g1_i1.p1 TRINITY_DN63169_c0_g1~~TRINITY_DN63169_c0_g1_i1.p1  ORF type:complete len:508 (-),score=41.20 TRINITY_DN63169_c0_g1_i1:163-1686(-)
MASAENESPKPVGDGALAVTESASSNESPAEHMNLVDAAEPPVSASPPSLAESSNGEALSTFEPPEEVKQWMSPEDWTRLSTAWEQAEAEAFAWAEECDDDLWNDDAVVPQRKPKQRRPAWDQNFSQVGSDARRLPPLRRYFDSLPSETSMPKQAVRRDIAKLLPNHYRPDIYSIQHPSFAPDVSEATARRLSRTSDSLEVMMEERERGWVSTFHMDVSVDNDKLHPHLRHLFDRRGFEASYRTRPELDKVTPVLRPRTPGRPSTREKIMRHSASVPASSSTEPVIDASLRGEGTIHWGRRCLTFGPDPSTRSGHDNSKIPWVSDHHRSESEDNELLNPLFRHYFDKSGIESSFRMRGRHYGRPLKSVMGIPAVYPGRSVAESGGSIESVNSADQRSGRNRAHNVSSGSLRGSRSASHASSVMSSAKSGGVHSRHSGGGSAFGGHSVSPGNRLSGRRGTSHGNDTLAKSQPMLASRGSPCGGSDGSGTPGSGQGRMLGNPFPQTYTT